MGGRAQLTMRRELGEPSQVESALERVVRLDRRQAIDLQWAEECERLCLHDVRYLIVHSAAHPTGVDQSAAMIHHYHRTPLQDGGRGWAGIGYHFVIRLDGSIERGRPLSRVGAHVLGANRVSMGVCCSGNGDLTPLSLEQERSVLLLARALRQVIPGLLLIGHREAVELLELGDRSDKTCPGLKVDMRRLRAAYEQS